MDYADGGDLQKLIDQQARSGEMFPEEQIWGYFKQICQGIAYCHMGGVIHRDLTPRNVLIQEGVLKITDFGISKQVKETIEA